MNEIFEFSPSKKNSCLHRIEAQKGHRGKLLDKDIMTHNIFKYYFLSHSVCTLFIISTDVLLLYYVFYYLNKNLLT